MRKTNAVIYFRRKREGRTDYLRRLSLLKSRKPRLVVRRTNKHTILQIIEYQPDGDKVLATATTQHLVKQGWKGSTNNAAAAYLAGKLLAKSYKGKEEIILDIGLQMHKSGSIIYAAVRGVKDGGAPVKCSEEVLTSDDRLVGEHVSEATRKQFAAFKEKIK